MATSTRSTPPVADVFLWRADRPPVPRIRTLKPEHKQHRKVGMLTHRQYRLWVGMITEADDDGRLVADVAQLRALIFAYHPTVTVRHIADDLATLTASGLIRLYQSKQTAYADFPSWRDHQKLDRAHYVASKLPSYQHSTTESLQVDSDETLGSQGREGNLTTQGREGKGVEGNREMAPAEPSPGTSDNGASAPTGKVAAPPAEIPPAVVKALERAPRLGPFLHDAAWWLSEMRANPTVDHAAELLKAEAWCRSNPERAPKKRPRAFLHRWFERAEHPI